MAQVGTLTVDMLLKSASFQSDLLKAVRSVQSSSNAMQRSLSQMQSGFTTLGGVAKGFFAGFAGVQGVRAFINLGKAAIEAGDSVGEAAARIGVSAEELQRFRYAAAQAGVETADLDVAMKTFARNLAQGKITASGDGLIGTFNNIIDKIANAPTLLEKTQIAVKAFGRSWQTSFNIAEFGTEKWAKAVKEANVITNEAARRASDLDEQMRKIGNAVQTGFDTGFINAFSKGLGTSATNAADLNKAMTTLGELAGGLAATAINMVNKIADFVKAHPELIRAITDPNYLHDAKAEPGTIVGAGRGVPQILAPASNARATVPGGPTHGGDSSNLSNLTANASAQKIAVTALSETKKATDAAKKANDLLNESVQEGSKLFIEMQDPLERHKSRIQELDAMLAKGTITADTYARAHMQANLEVANSYIDAAGQITGTLSGAFKQVKAFAIADAVVSVAQGIAKAFTLPFPLNWAQAAAVGAAGASQIATIMSAQPGSSKRPSAGGGGGRGGGGGGNGQLGHTSGTGKELGGAPVGAATGGPQRVMNLSIHGEMFGREQVRQLAEQLKDFQRDGGTIVIN